MTKELAIKLVNKKLNMNINGTNTNWSNINSNGIWSIEPNCNRKANKLFLLLHNDRSKKIHVFEISANNDIYNKLYKRNDRNVFRLLFDVNDTVFIEKLEHLNFKNFLKGTVDYI
jgi:hypothetical protein